MGRHAAGVGGWLVSHALPQRRHGAVGHDDRRAAIGVALHRAERADFANFRHRDGVAHLSPGGVAERARVLQAGAGELVAHRRVIRTRLRHGPVMHRPTFRLIAREQPGPAPALQHGRHLPPEIDRVADAHVHPEAAERRVQVAGIARQEHAPLAVAFGDQPVSDPGIGADDLDVEIEPGRAADQIGMIGPAINEFGRDEIPQPIAAHRAEQPGHVVVHHPVHYGGTVRVQTGQLLRPEHEIEVGRECAVPQQLHADQLAHQALGPIRADEIAGADFAAASQAPRARRPRPARNSRAWCRS